jgi:hypothetical protein
MVSPETKSAEVFALRDSQYRKIEDFPGVKITYITDTAASQ